MKIPGFIVFSGIDSSGKSTQIDLVNKYFTGKDIKVKVIWSRVGYTPLFNLMKIILRKIMPSRIPSPGESEFRKKTLSKKWVRILWLNISLMDMLLFYGIYFRLLRLFGYTVIADRYIWDSYIDLILKFGLNNVNSNGLFRSLIILSPVSSFTFLLTVPVQESLRRSNLKNEPFSENLNQRKKRLDLYQELIEKGKWGYIIDGLGTIDDVWSNIRNKLG